MRQELPDIFCDSMIFASRAPESARKEEEQDETRAKAANTRALLPGGKPYETVPGRGHGNEGLENGFAAGAPGRMRTGNPGRCAWPKAGIIRGKLLFMSFPAG